MYLPVAVMKRPANRPTRTMAPNIGRSSSPLPVADEPWDDCPRIGRKVTALVSTAPRSSPTRVMREKLAVLNSARGSTAASARRSTTSSARRAATPHTATVSNTGEVQASSLPPQVVTRTSAETATASSSTPG